jgi:hypothetical protein
MKKELRDKFYGQTVDDWIDKLPGELPADAPLMETAGQSDFPSRFLPLHNGK